MALKKSITKEISINNADIIKSTGVNIPSTVTLSDVYFKIKSIEGDKNNLIISIEGVYTYKTVFPTPVVDADGETTIVQQEYDVKDVVYNNFFSFTPSVEDNSPNFIKQCYEYLKTLDEFKDAMGC